MFKGCLFFLYERYAIRYTPLDKGKSKSSTSLLIFAHTKNLLLRFDGSKNKRINQNSVHFIILVVVLILVEQIVYGLVLNFY